MLATLEHEAIHLEIPLVDLTGGISPKIILPTDEDVVKIALEGEFAGVAMMARDFAPFIEFHWPNQRVKGVATGLAESHLRVGAYNINYKDGKPTTIDCGPMQDNVPIDSDLVDKLKTTSTDPLVYKPVVKYNVWYAYQLWASRTDFRDGHVDYRRWRPWVAVTSGWAWYPRCWCWHHERDENGKLVPKGPWVKTGQYLQKAIRGVANHDILHKGKSPKEALAWAKFVAESQWGIPETWVAWDYTDKKLVYYIHEPQPTDPPTAHENWGYPVPNDGR